MRTVVLSNTFIVANVTCQSLAIIRLEDLWRTNGSKLGPAKTISAKSVAPLTCEIHQERKVTETSDEFLYDAFDVCLITITAKRITEERATKVPYLTFTD